MTLSSTPSSTTCCHAFFGLAAKRRLTEFAKPERTPPGAPRRGRAGLGGSGSLSPTPSFRAAAVPRAPLPAAAGAGTGSVDSGFSVAMFARSRSAKAEIAALCSDVSVVFIPKHSFASQRCFWLSQKTPLPR
eukprot:15452586-Alexandrium_andersonii.AAC.1